MRYRASRLKLLLEELKTDAKKSLSQNFLIDGNIVRKIVSAAAVQENDQILEIGPGPGALTEALLMTQAHVTAIEIDDTLIQSLQELKSDFPKFTLIHGDFLQISLEPLLQTQTTPWKVIANLPYHITTPTLMKLLPLYPLIQSVTVMVQKEVADRLIAKPKTSSYNHLSLACSFYSNVKSCFTVEPTCFYPQPKVKSAVVQFQLHEPPLPLEEREDFFLLTRTAFQKKRKMLRGSLEDLYSKEKMLNTLIHCGLKDTTRPEELSLEEWIHLFFALRA